MTQYTGRLDVGVTVFFLISGFLLYRPFVRARLRGEAGARAWPRTAWRRFLRIVPAYWVALTVVALWHAGLLCVHGDRRADLLRLRPDLRLRRRDQRDRAGVDAVRRGHLLRLPAALGPVDATGDAAARAISTELLGLAALFLFSTAYKVWALRHISPNNLDSPRFLMPLPNFLDQFAVGMGLAVLSVHYEDRPLPAPLAFIRRTPGASWAVALVAFWVVSTQIGYTGNFFQSIGRAMFLERHELYTVVATALILPVVFGQPGRGLAGKLLASRPLRFLGLVSYGIYLYHLAVVNKVQRWLGASLPSGFAAHFFVYLGLGFLGATALAVASYYLVERPALRLRNLVPTTGPTIPEPAPVQPETITS